MRMIFAQKLRIPMLKLARWTLRNLLLFYIDERSDYK